MTHRASAKFWDFYEQLPRNIRRLADRNYALLKQNPSHRSLHFKKVAAYWSVRVGRHYRAVGIEEAGTIVWFWIGRHDRYDEIIGRRT